MWFINVGASSGEQKLTVSCVWTFLSGWRGLLCLVSCSDLIIPASCCWRAKRPERPTDLCSSRPLSFQVRDLRRPVVTTQIRILHIVDWNPVKMSPNSLFQRSPRASQLVNLSKRLCCLIRPMFLSVWVYATAQILLSLFSLLRSLNGLQVFMTIR